MKLEANQETVSSYGSQKNITRWIRKEKEIGRAGNVADSYNKRPNVRLPVTDESKRQMRRFAAENGFVLP